jgi:hypothetical protein
VAVAAGSEFAVVDGDRVTLRQDPGCGVACDSRSDNRNAHSRPLSSANLQAATPLSRKVQLLAGVKVAANKPKAHEIFVRLRHPANRAGFNKAQ